MFKQTEILYLLWAAPVLFLLLAAYRRWQKKALQRLGVTVSMQPSWLFWLRGVLTIAAFCLMVLAWANPQRNARIKQTAQKSADVIILLDISQSMLAQDAPPSRLELAQWFATKLVNALAGERIGLVFFAGSSFLQMPLSTDYPFMIESIRSASPDLLSTQGSDIEGAISLAMQSFDEVPAGRAIILLSDGESHDENPSDKAAEAFDEGAVIYTILTGTPEGGPIPEPSGDYKRDPSGNLVRTMANPAAMQEIARAGGGVMYYVSQGDAAVSAIRQAVQNMDKRAISVRSYTEFDPYYQWFLLPAWLLLLGAWLPGFLNGAKRWSALFLLLFCANIVAAQSPGHSARRKGDAAYNNGRFQEAENSYQKSVKQSPKNEKSAYNLGNAQYRQGEYAAAAESFSRAAELAQTSTDKADALYNLGNAHLHQKQFKEAIQAYEQSLRLRPGDPAAKANLQFAKKQLKESAAQQPQQQDQNQQSGQQNTPPGEQKKPEANPQEGEENKEPAPRPQPGQKGQQQTNAEKPQPGSQARRSQQEALKMLETTVGRDDKKTAKKYRENDQKPKPTAPQKDW